MMPELIGVSVIIPCFRCSNSIFRAIESVAKQTLRPAEIILIDDDSSDGTLEILHKIQSAHPEDWIKVISLEKNSGPATARNIGWEKASQPFVAFLDADDSWHPEKIEIQYCWMIENHHIMLTGHSRIEINEKCSKQLSKDHLKSPRDITPITKIQLLLSNKFPTSSLMLRRDIIQRFPEGKYYSEDYHLCLDICLSGLACFRFDLPLAFSFKPDYGRGGLSEALLKMEKGEINTYLKMYKQRYIGRITLFAILVFSSIKFAIRLLLNFIIYLRN